MSLVMRATLTDALTKRDTFDMRRAREHIDWLDPGKPVVAIAAEEALVTRECCRIAGDIDERLWRKLLDGSQDAGITAGAWWVHQGDINALVRTYELVNHALDLAIEKRHILEAVRLGVGARIRYSA
jgi:hypothetical protein